MDVEDNNFLENIKESYANLQKFGKKEKKRKSLNFKYLGRKTVGKKKESKRQELLTKLLKKKTKGKDDVIALMVDEGIQAEEEDVNQYQSLSKLISFNRKYSLPSNVVSGEFYVYILSGVSLVSSKLTSDLLYWANRCYKMLDEGSRSFLSLDKVRVSSIEAVVVNDSVDITETFVNDFNVDVSSPFFYRGVGGTIDELYKKYSVSGTFKMNGKDMYELTSKDDDLLDSFIYTYEKESPWPATFKIIQDTEYMNSESGVLKSGVKIVSKTPGVYYFDKDIVPTTFCPVSLDLKKKQEFYVAYKLVLNMDEYINACIEKKGVLTFKGFLTFENVEKFMVLIEIVSISLNSVKKSVKNVLDYYKSNKEAFIVVKKHYKHFKKIVLGYIDAFHNKINLDRLTKLLEDINKYISDDDFLLSSKVEVETLNALFNVDEVFDYLKNYLNPKVRNAVELMKYSLMKVTVPPKKGEVVESIDVNIRSTAMLLFDFLMTGKSPCIMTIRSPASFLGNLIGDSGKTVLKANLDNFFETIRFVSGTKDEIEDKVNKMVTRGREEEKMKLLKELAGYVADGKLGDIKDYLIKQGYVDAVADEKKALSDGSKVDDKMNIEKGSIV